MLTVSWQPIMMASFFTQHTIDKPQGPCEDDLVGQMQPAVMASSGRDAVTHTRIHTVETDGSKNKPPKIFNLLTQKTA